MLRSLRLHLPLVRVLASTLLSVRKLRRDEPADFSDFVASHLASRGDALALIGEGSRFSWSELDRFAQRVACWAIGAGLERGDVVALSMENRPEYVALWLGLSRVGVVTALLNTHLTGERLAHCVREASPRAWIIGRELMDETATAFAHLDRLPPLYSADGLGVATSSDAKMPIDAETRGFELVSLDERLAATALAPLPPERLAARRGSDLMFLIYTSGTTGLPKAARISHLKAVLTGLASMKAQALGPEDRVYCCLPLYHTAGGVMAVGAALMAGGAFAVARRFSASHFWSDCVRYEATSFQYIGELCRYLVNSPSHPDERRHRIRCVMGNGLRPDVWESFQERFAIPRIVEFYGATEGNLALLNMSGRTGSVGQLPGFVRKRLGIELLRFDVEQDALVRDASGRCQPCAPGEAGELVIRISPQARFEGYTNAAATEKKILRDAFAPGDAWFRTGDLLRMDPDGFYYFVDRIGDTFRWKGENVATSEVAEVLSVDPGVDEANVYGVSIAGHDGRAGMAALVVNDQFDLARISALVGHELAAYARPVFLRLLPAMEVTGTFKHRKVDLVREGFDPGQLTDPVYFLDPAQGCYVSLDAASCEAIRTGAIRI